MKQPTTHIMWRENYSLEKLEWPTHQYKMNTITILPISAITGKDMTSMHKTKHYMGWL